MIKHDFTNSWRSLVKGQIEQTCILLKQLKYMTESYDSKPKHRLPNFYDISDSDKPLLEKF